MVMMMAQVKPTGAFSENAKNDSKKQFNPSLGNIGVEWHALSEEDVKYVDVDSDQDEQSHREV